MKNIREKKRWEQRLISHGGCRYILIGFEARLVNTCILSVGTISLSKRFESLCQQSYRGKSQE
jgi:hypothetical protein